jgi:hypothetical protein
VRGFFPGSCHHERCDRASAPCIRPLHRPQLGPPDLIIAVIRPESMRRLLAILSVAWALAPSVAGACGLSGPWYIRSDDGYTGIFIIERVIDETSCEARLSVFSPLGDSAVEACRVLRSDKVVIYCDIVSGGFFKAPDNFILEDQGEVLKGRWISDISANVVFLKQ